MLFITGNFNGKTYVDDAPIDPKVIAEYYKLPMPPKDQESHVLRIHPDRISTRDGVRKHFASWTPQTRASLSDGENSFIIRYARNTGVDAKRNKTFTPNNIKLGGSAAFDKNTYDLFVFMCLSKQVAGGPFSDPSMVQFYELYNPAKEQAAQTKKADLLNTKIPEIQKMSPENLMLKARALGIVGSYAEVFSAVIQRMSADIEAFVRVWDDDNTTFYGQIMDAIAKNVITQGVYQGATSWIWGPTTPNAGIRICTVPQGEDALRKLTTFLSQTENSVNIMPALLEAIGYRDMVKPLVSEPEAKAAGAPPKEDATPGDFITKVAKSEAVELNGNAVFFKGDMICILKEDQDTEAGIREFYTNMDDEAKKSWRMRFINAAK